MITAFVGIYFDDEHPICSIRGNGKSCSMTYDLYQKKLNGYKIFTNYFTTFSEKMPAQEILNFLIMESKLPKEERKYKKIAVGLTEIGQIVNSLGSEQASVLFFAEWISQTRKMHTDLEYDIQRFADAHKRLRIQTDIVFRCEKFHKDGSICPRDDCELHHYIKIWRERPFFPYPALHGGVLDTWKIGQMYDTDEVIFDSIKIRRKKINKGDDNM